MPIGHPSRVQFPCPLGTNCSSNLETSKHYMFHHYPASWTRSLKYCRLTDSKSMEECRQPTGSSSLHSRKAHRRLPESFQRSWWLRYQSVHCYRDLDCTRIRSWSTQSRIRSSIRQVVHQPLGLHQSNTDSFRQLDSMCSSLSLRKGSSRNSSNL